MRYSGGNKGESDPFRRGATPNETPSDDSYMNTDGSATESTGATTDSPPETSEDQADGGADIQDTSESEVDRMLTELAAQRDRYARLAAEYDNYRKRTMRERSEAGSKAQADLLKTFVDALDDLSRFAHVDPSTVDSGTVVQGVDMVERKLLKALGAAGLTIINPLDQAFDPSQHEAVATEPALSREDDHMVARVYQPGYLFNGQLLRPARVVVKQWS
jgi:molecular chaperone GrpE